MSAQSAPPQKMLQEVVNDVIQVFGLEEEVGENLEGKVVEVYQELGEKPHLVEVIRLGYATSGKTRPVKVTTSSSIYAHQILRRRSVLTKESGKFSSVFIAPDRTFEEWQKRPELVTALMRRVSDDSSRRHFYIRRGEVCSE